jgi:hypothetical protein
MTHKCDGAIIFDASAELGPDRYRREIIRPLAPFALHQTVVKHLPSTVINYTNHWDPDDLANTLCAWLDSQGIKRPMLLVSTLFTLDTFNPRYTITKVVEILKKHYPCLLLLGGPINILDYEPSGVRPDIVFQGRSLHLFKKWLVNDADDLPIQYTNGVEVYNHRSSIVVEDPIVPELFDDYCLSPWDIIHFETRLGCKFNCTFCTFEFRNAKKVNDSSPYKLYKFFKAANEKYGITSFSCVDDTFNEDIEKLENLSRAIEPLSFRPRIVGYNRFDLLMRFPDHAYILDQCGFHGHYFGIETVHTEASKIIRKGIRKERAYEFMRFLRDTFPHWWTSSGYIVGLPGEPAEHIMSVMKDIREEKLLDSVMPSPLGIYNVPGNEHNFSDFGKDPKKYGITVTSAGYDAEWHHSLMDKKTANVLAAKMAAKNTKLGLPAVDCWEWSSRQIAPDNFMADVQIQHYIARKRQFLKKSAG